MIHCNILFDENDKEISPSKIYQLINNFGESYKDSTNKIITKSESLDKNGKTFIECGSLILSNFGMTRRGVFSESLQERLQACWDKIGEDILLIKDEINNSGKSRDRFLLEISNDELKNFASQVWFMTKEILPITMSKSSYGLVGASKILFSILPEIVLPIDNQQWKELFKTVDLGDVIEFMTEDVHNWENMTGEQLNTLDKKNRLTTLPSVYNVIAMAARPRINDFS